MDDVSQNLLCELGIKCLRMRKKKDVCVWGGGRRIDIKIQANSNQVRRIRLNVIAVLRVCIRSDVLFSYLFHSLFYSLSLNTEYEVDTTLMVLNRTMVVCMLFKPHANSALTIFFMLNSIAHKNALK